MTRSIAHPLRPGAMLGIGLLTLALVVTILGDAPAAHAKPGHHRKALILSPHGGQKVPARPLRIRVRAGGHAKVKAWLNGQVIQRRHFRLGKRRGVRRAKVSPSHGLKHGRNRLRVRVRRHGARHPRVRRVRFRVGRHRPLAAAGLDRKTIAGTPTYIHGFESRRRPGRRSRGAAATEGLSYSWAIKSAPPAASVPAAPLDTPTWVPTFTDPGTYVLSLVVSEDGTESAPDDVTIRVVAPPMVDVDTQLKGGGGPDDWGIKVGSAEYSQQAGAWLQVLVLNRETLEPVTNKSFSCTGSTPSCIDQVKQAFSGQNALDDRYLVLAANHPGGQRGPAGAPDALKAIGVGVSGRGWPWYVDPTSPNASGGYSAVGVPGDPAGTAAEAWDRNTDASVACDAGCADVRGYLMQDYTDVLNYNWISAERVSFDTRAAGSSDTQNVIQIGDHKYPQALGAGQTGGFQVVAADRYDLSKVQTHWFPTAGSSVNEATYESSLDGLAATLRDAASTPVVNGLPGADGKPLCLDLKDYNVFGVPVTVAVSATCDGTSEQQVVAVPGISPGDGSAGVELRAKGGCIGVVVTGDEQPPVALEDCGGQDWQQWHFDDQGRIVGFNGKCLAISGAAADHNKPGQPLVVASCQPYVSQQWHTDSSQMAFVAPIGKPQVRLTAGSPDEHTTYVRGQKIAAVGDAVAALGGTANAFNSLPGGSVSQLYGLVGWSGAVPARAPQEAGPISDEMPTARIAGTLSTDKWQRYEVQDTEPGAARVEPEPPAGANASLATQAEDTDPMDLIWGAPTTLWPDQSDGGCKAFPGKLNPATLDNAGCSAAVAWISRQPSIHQGGDVRAAFFKSKWSSASPDQWTRTSDAISKLTYSACDAACQQTFTAPDLQWAQTELEQEIQDLKTTHEYLSQLLMAQGSAGAVFNFNNQVDAVAQQLQKDQVVPAPSPKDKTAVWTRLIIDGAIDLVGAIPAVGPFAKEGFEIARSIVEAGSAITNGILDGVEIAKETETGEPGPPSDELSGAVNDVKTTIAKQYNDAQNSTDMFARIVASDPAKLSRLATLRDGCRSNDSCPADWRLEVQDQAKLESALSYSTAQTVWSTLVPGYYTAWQLRIRAYGPNVQHTGAKHYPTTISGFSNGANLECYFNPGIGPEQYIHPFAGASANGMAAFRQGYGYEGDGAWEGPGDSLDYGSNRVLWKVWVLGLRPDGDNENYTVPGPHVFDRLFGPVDPSLNPDKGGLGVDKATWYAQTFAAREYSPKDPKWYGGPGSPYNNDRVLNCQYTG